MMLTSGPVAQKFPQSWLTGTGINADIGLRLRGIVTRCFVYFV
jgi:hypothetical protein